MSGNGQDQAAAAKRAMMQELQNADPNADPSLQKPGISSDNYKNKRFERALSPVRADPFALQTPAEGQTTYKDIMQNAALERENAEIHRKIARMREEKGGGICFCFSRGELFGLVVWKTLVEETTT